MIRVDLKEQSYDIIIASNKLGQFAEILKKLDIGKDAIIITNIFLKQKYGTLVKSALKKQNFNAFFITVADTEKSKSLNTYDKVIAKIARYDIKREIFLIAFGGGVVGDLTGFLAATYKRGIPYVQLPTTLLAQVDSAIGGKTGIDLPDGKNLIGSFYQPRLVFIDTLFLNTLPKRQIISGFAEAIKYAIIFDRKFFTYLDKYAHDILNLKKDKICCVIDKCSRLKAHVVSVDEKEKKGYRTILNLGHTIGHALEAACAYTPVYTHGEAVAIGTLCAAEISNRLGLLSEGDLRQIENLILKYALPAKIQHGSIKNILQAFTHDKKFIRKKNRLVLPLNIGHVAVVEDVPQKLIEKVIKARRTPHG